METAGLTHIGQIVGLDLYERKWTGTALVIAPRADLGSVHGVIADRWRTLLAAMSSGIAHMDPSDPQIDLVDKAYSEYQRVAISVPGASLPSSGRRVVFFAAEETRMALDDVSVAYALLPLTHEWKQRLSGATIVDVDPSPKN
ncbi:MAG: hypothetical protein ABI461_15660 [Polyangiaceae bacterium]